MTTGEKFFKVAVTLCSKVPPKHWYNEVPQKKLQTSNDEYVANCQTQWQSRFRPCLACTIRTLRHVILKGVNVLSTIFALANLVWPCSWVRKVAVGALLGSCGSFGGSRGANALCMRWAGNRWKLFDHTTAFLNKLITLMLEGNLATQSSVARMDWRQMTSLLKMSRSRACPAFLALCHVLLHTAYVPLLLEDTSDFMNCVWSTPLLREEYSLHRCENCGDCKCPSVLSQRSSDQRLLSLPAAKIRPQR